MSDNVTIPATGSGDATPKVACDEVTYSGDTAKVQLARTVFVTGAEGSKTVIDPPAGAGVVTTGTPRITLASDDPAVASLSVLDDWDESDRAKVNIVAGQAGITAGAGAVGASTPRMTLASDDPAVTSLAIMDDWDESDRAKVNPIVGQAGVAGGAGAVSATTQRVALATDANVVQGAGTAGSASGGVVSVQGVASGTALPVSAASLPLPSGAATSAEQATQTASLSVMDDWDESDRAKVNPIAGQAGVAGGSGTVSALTQRVVLATDVALPAGTNAIGKLAANSGVDIGDVDIASIAAGDNNIGNVDIASTPKSSAVSAAAQVSQGTTAAEVLAANASRKCFTIQNTGTTILKFRLHASSDPTATVYHFALPPCLAADDALGGFYSDDLYPGAVRAVSSGAGGTMVITEYT